ncbi:hypothetical protein [Pilimelia anulata]|uniref:hypothetical protein n=1 Tax=Pilimelia anulata TaxID=53371 RepID=UPI001664D6C5|nr:hypothetical protein [Pilimelia anulata]
MNSSAKRRRYAAATSGRGRRLFAAAAVLAVLGATVAVTQVSSANERRAAGQRAQQEGQQEGQQDGQQGRNQQGRRAWRDGTRAGGNQSGGNPRTKVVINGLNVLTRSCNGSRLQPHDGFQAGLRCVNTQFGEVSAAAQNPSLLITGTPRQVRVGQDFNLQVSSRNLVRDRFLGAADGGYYLEASLLNGQGLQRGHIHTACRMLQNQQVAQNPDPDPAFFEATEDNRGSARPDNVVIRVDGMPQRGVAQCSVWAGDGSHRLPMMERANQTPAFDTVRIAVV